MCNDWMQASVLVPESALASEKHQRGRSRKLVNRKVLSLSELYICDIVVDPFQLQNTCLDAYHPILPAKFDRSTPSW